MATVIQRRRGTTAQHATFAGAVGEITVDTTKKVAVVHDGATLGGIPMVKESDIAGKANTADVAAALALKADATETADALNGKQPLDAMLTALAALISANGKFLAFSGPDAPAVRDILGTVSQSSGIPSGAIVEKGSNANGEWTKFADGMMVCRNDNVGSVAPSTASGSVFTANSGLSWTFPQAFVGLFPIPSAAHIDFVDSTRWLTVDSVSLTSCRIQVFRTASSATAGRIGCSAIGRWF